MVNAHTVARGIRRRRRRIGPVLYRQSGTWSDYTDSKSSNLVSDCLPIREVIRAIRLTGRFNQSTACVFTLDFEFRKLDSPLW